MKTPADVFAVLWARALAEGVDYIVYRGALNTNEANTDGWFHPEVTHRKKPQIQLFRRPPPLPTPHDKPDLTTKPTHDCLILAHEYGHFRSWLGSERGTTKAWRSYFAAASARDSDPKNLSEEQRRLILEEEARAWELARVVLGELGVEDWTEYERYRDEGLEAHRRHMGLT